MTKEIAYSQPGAIVAATAVSIATSETTLVTLTDAKYFRKSQLTVYFDCSLGSATSVKIRYYQSPDNGVTYYQLPYRNDSTGELIDDPTVLDSNSPIQASTHIRTYEDIPITGTTAYKITGQAVGSTATMNVINVFAKDN